jgi:hypothetical protein
MVAKLLLLSLATLAMSQGDCKNPLFSAEGWKESGAAEEIDIIALKDTPSVTEGLKTCKKWNGKSSCLDLNGDAQVETGVKGQKEGMEEKGESRMGGKRDLINDFDVENQKEKIGCVEIAGDGRRL